MANVLGSYLANANNYQVSDFEPIKKEQIKIMVDNQNRCSDWSKVYFDRAILDSGAIFESLNSIRNCSFNGDIFLTSFYGNVTSHKGMVVQCGLYDSTFSGRCIIQQNALVTHSYLHNCCIGKEAVVVCCPLVLHSGQSLSYGNYKTISVGNESGGRIVTLSLGSSFQSLVRQAFNAKKPQDMTLAVENRRDFEDCRDAMVVIGEKAVVFHCDEVIDSIVGDGCSCTSSSLHSSILWFDSSQTSSVVRSVVKGCLLDPGCSATDCNVMDTYLMDQASIGTTYYPSASL